MSISVKQHNDAIDAIDRLDALITLAKANFPRSTDIEISAAGTAGSGSISLPCHVLSTITAAGRKALEEAGDA